jgi:hypothetical protein
METINEIDLVKTKLSGIDTYDLVELQNWDVDEAIPASDIIWSELNKGRSYSLIVKFCYSVVFPLMVCGLGVFLVILFD